MLVWQVFVENEFKNLHFDIVLCFRFFLGSFWCSTMKRDMVEDQVLLLSIGNNVMQLPSVFFILNGVEDGEDCFPVAFCY